MRHLIRLVISALAVVLVLPAAAFATGAPALERAPVNPDFKKARALGLAHRASPVDVGGLAGARIAPAGFDPPESFDLRVYGKVSSVKNQGAYATCWPFAALASLESCLLPGEAWDFSEDSLAYFHGFDLGYNEGGTDYMATAVLTRWRGPFTETQDRYGDGEHPAPSSLAVQKHVQNVLFLPPRASAADNDDIKYALMTYGAVSTGMYSEGMSLSSSYFNDATDAYYYPHEEDWENHGVTIVGWDDNYAAANFATTPPDKGAFLVKNSWGTGWGADGYFWLSYYDAMTAYDLSAVYYGAESPKNYARIYQYDPLGYVTRLGYSDASWMANGFTAVEDGVLRAVGFYTTGPDTAYEVYTQGTSADSRRWQAGGTFTTFGYHTVALSSPVTLTKGQRFYPVVKLTTPDFRGVACNEIAVEMPQPDYYYSDGATASPGQSFISWDGVNWVDLTSQGADLQEANVCLKAYVGLRTAWVSKPVAPTVMYRYKARNVYGYLKPRHAADTYPVRIYKYRYVSGKWKSYGYAKAKASTYYSYTKYSAAVKLPYRGKWRLRAYHPADAGHAASWSAGYDYVTVK